MQNTSNKKLKKVVSIITFVQYGLFLLLTIASLLPVLMVEKDNIIYYKYVIVFVTCLILTIVPIVTNVFMVTTDNRIKFILLAVFNILTLSPCFVFLVFLAFKPMPSEHI